MIPMREMVTDKQINTVLDVLRDLQPYILLTQREVDSAIPKELDGGVASSATTTFIRACNRLDAMLDDAERWTLRSSDSLYDAMKAHYEAAVKVTASQLDAVANMQRPSRRLKPSFTRIGEEFIAFWGTADLPGGMILGRGPTPEVALNDFDAAFERRAAEQIQFAPASEERLKKTPPTKKRKS